MEEKNDGDRWQTRASKLFCLLAIALLVYLTLRYAGGVLLVFSIAWAVAAVIDPLARKTEQRIGLPRKLWAVLYVILLLVFLGVGVFWIVSRLARELEGLMAWLGEHAPVIVGKIGEGVAYLGELPAKWTGEAQSASAEQLRESLTGMLLGVMNDFAESFGGRITALLGGLLRMAPEALITVVVTVMACFYLSMDYRGIRDRLIGMLPSTSAQTAHRVRIRAASAIRGYLRAYVVLFLLTFVQIFVGLLILRQRYAFLLAILIALIDILPVLGTGTVLIPWAIVSLLLKNYSFGFGLLILYGVVTVVRQIAEPHLVGGSLGLHPLASLFFMFLGFQLFGVFGMLLGPAAAFIAKEFFVPSKRETES